MLHRFSRRPFAFESLELRRLFATDLLSDAVGLTATTSIEVGETSYFFADDGVHGQELWKSDSTPAGTTLVKDLTAGAGGTELVSFFECDGRLVFVTVVDHPPTNRLRRDYTVWSSDGTDAGTVKLLEFKDVLSVQFKQVGERVALVANRLSDAAPDLTDALLYFTDGTTAGTVLVREFLAELANAPGTSDHPFSTRHMFASGDRLVFDLSETWIWASDGTAAGTVDLTEALEPSGFISAGSMLQMFEYDGEVWLPRAGKLSSTDGTVAGTAIRTFTVTGHLDPGQSALSGDTFYFGNVVPPDGGEPGYRALKAYHIPNGTLTEVYRPTDMAGESYFLRLHKIGDHLLMHVVNHTRNAASLWLVHGTTAAKFADLSSSRSIVPSTVSLDGVAYFVMAEGTAAESNDSTDPVGWIGGGTGKALARGGHRATITLWRTDGTQDGTGVVRTLWEGDPAGKEVFATLSTGTGVLLIRTTIRTGVTSGLDFTPDGLVTIWDDTLAYRPEELNLARDFAIARMVNGVLRLKGSMGPDTFRLERPESDPSLLVVEVNGVARSFAFNSIRRIIADLQDGNDTLEIVESPGRDIRLWTSVLGGDGADTILTATGRDTIIGGSGGDTIRSRGNADLIIGGGGRDRITGGQGDDVISGGTGNDAIITNTGHDVLFGQNAVESAFGQLWEDGDTEEDLVLPAL